MTLRAVVMCRPGGFKAGGTDETMQRTCILLEYVAQHVPFLLVVSLPVNLIVIKVVKGRPLKMSVTTFQYT